MRFAFTALLAFLAVGLAGAAEILDSADFIAANKGTSCLEA